LNGTCNLAATALALSITSSSIDSVVLMKSS
jgi:hypothetical protein